MRIKHLCFWLLSLASCPAFGNNCRDYQMPLLFVSGYKSVIVDHGYVVFQFNYENNFWSSGTITKSSKVIPWVMENDPIGGVLKAYTAEYEDTTYYYYNSEEHRVDSTFLPLSGNTTHFTGNNEMYSETTYDSEGTLVSFDSIFYTEEGRIEKQMDMEISTEAQWQYCRGLEGVCACFGNEEFTDSLELFYHSDGKLDSIYRDDAENGTIVFHWIEEGTFTVPRRVFRKLKFPLYQPVDVMGRNSGNQSKFPLYFR